MNGNVNVLVRCFLFLFPLPAEFLKGAEPVGTIIASFSRVALGFSWDTGLYVQVPNLWNGGSGKYEPSFYSNVWMYVEVRRDNEIEFDSDTNRQYNNVANRHHVPHFFLYRVMCVMCHVVLCCCVDCTKHSGTGNLESSI